MTLSDLSLIVGMVVPSAGTGVMIYIQLVNRRIIIQTRQDIAVVHKATNSLMDQAQAATAITARAEGVAEGQSKTDTLETVAERAAEHVMSKARLAEEQIRIAATAAAEKVLRDAGGR